HTRCLSDWSSDVCSSDLEEGFLKKRTSNTDQAIGVIGLGIMGSAMAANLAKAGYRVCGYDIVAARRAALRKAGGTPQGSIAQLRSEERRVGKECGSRWGR